MSHLLVIVGIAFVVFGLGYVIDRWIIPWRADRLIKRVLSAAQSGHYVPPPKQSDFAIAIDADGLSVNNTHTPSTALRSIAWSEIVRVTAFKRDRFTVDRLCIEIATEDGGSIEVNEDMESWEALTEDMPKYLSGSTPCSEWFLKVAFPAFDANETVISDKLALGDSRNADKYDVDDRQVL